MKTTKEMIAIMQAYEDGQPIQYKLRWQGDWAESSPPAWDWSMIDYRVKPAEPKTVMMQTWQRIDGTLFAEEISKSFGTRNKNKPKQPYKKVGEPYEFVFPEEVK